MAAMGIDIGGSGIKGAPVDTVAGKLIKDRLRIPTPDPSEPGRVAEVVREIVEEFAWTGPIGVTFPGVVLDGIVRTAANMDKSWIGTDAAALFAGVTGQKVTVLNDADAAGLAEVSFGAGRDLHGVVLVLTFGTGIGSALFVDGHLVPNTEFGHLQIRGKEAEARASAQSRTDHDLSWDKWAERVEEYLEHVEMLLSPNLIVIGGGVSRKAEKFLPHLKLRTPLVPASLQNEAGIIGAACVAAVS
ncbi:polyphosphate--glucose phosphotransferase [Sinosporangium siamense]|uniref:Polyphosphate glucokinase n=1 Tax=Sinosporangium siamense TaxID=1367973 RepID=A0A919RC52_9ACTN|nr:ROK family protein [Sinosporangium siamense]GII89774.1 polyphosphate glucokinase [Sinosporangium siamense]